MDGSFVDLDVLLTKVRNTQSKIYFLDAVKAYKAGAFRASLTSAWVAVVYDLVAKYRQLSAMGDAAASAAVSEWDSATANSDIKKLLQLEANILEKSTTITQMISTIAKVHLSRLREDRHLCAHPAFSAEAELFEPTPDLVRLHLVNVVNFVLAQEPLLGKTILNSYDLDVQSPGFPTAHARVLDYVQQRYLERTRLQNVRSFGIVLAKSLIKGTPPHWEPQQRKILSSLVAVRERAVEAWPDISHAIIGILDSLEPGHRPRAISFIAAFPEFWPRLLDHSRTSLQATVENIVPSATTDYRVLAGVELLQFRPALQAVINSLSSEDLATAIAVQPLGVLWPRALETYRKSGSYRTSEHYFRALILPFAGRLKTEQLDLLIDAVIANGQNWDAAETNTLLQAVLRNADAADRPTFEARDRLYKFIRRVGRTDRYLEVFKLLLTDGWGFPPPESEYDD